MEQLVVGGMVLILLALAGYYARQQVRTLRRVRAAPEMPTDERHFWTNQAYRRIVNSVFMFGLGGLIAGTYLSGQEDRARALGERLQAKRAAGEPAEKTDEEEQFSQRYLRYWMATMVLLLAVVLFAGYDLFATRRYAVRQLRRIQSDRREMIETELRRHRHGHNGTL